MRRGALIALALAACHQREARPRPSHDEALRRMSACVKALGDVATSFGVMKSYPDACSSIASEPRCRDAMARPADLTGAWPAGMVTACAEAYCGQLPAPKPGVCQGGAATEEGWGELWGSIMLYELGIDDPAVRRQLDRAFAPVSVTVHRDATPPPAACSANVIVTIGADDAAVSTGATPRVIAPCGGSRDHTALALALCDAIRAAPCVPQLVLQAQKGVRHGDVVELMELAKSAGVTKIAIGTTDRVTLDHADAEPARCAEPTPSVCP